MRSPDEKEAVIKSLNRQVKAGSLSKLSRGRYFKPEQTPFGTLAPPQEEIVKDLLWKGDQPIGYLTGLSIYHHLGLSQQIGNAIQIGSNDIRPSFQRGKYKISFVRQKNPISRSNIPLLQILDAIRYIKKIPATKPVEAITILRAILQEKGIKEIRKLTELARKYPPSTRALLGAMLEANQVAPKYLEALKKSLNPITVYRFKEIAQSLKTAANWNVQ